LRERAGRRETVAPASAVRRVAAAFSHAGPACRPPPSWAELVRRRVSWRHLPRDLRPIGRRVNGCAGWRAGQPSRANSLLCAANPFGGNGFRTASKVAIVWLSDGSVFSPTATVG